MSKAKSKGGYELRDSPFFRLRSRKKLADILCKGSRPYVSPKTLTSISKKPGSQLYLRRWKPKDSDEMLKSEPQGELADKCRPIDIPDFRLKILQSRIADLLSRVKPPDFLFSPVKGRSYVDNAARHLGAEAGRVLDVANFFTSCTANNVARFFQRDLECSPDVTAILVRLTTLETFLSHREKFLPQGSPCSPILAYYSNRPMWEEINTIVEQAKCKMSLYIDDIAITGAMLPKGMIWRVKQTVHKHGLKLKNGKEKSLFSGYMEVTGGIVGGERLLLPNRQRKRLIEKKAERRQTKDPTRRRELDNQIAGRLAQWRQVEQT